MHLSTYDLFERTKVPLIDYHLKGVNAPKRHNGMTIWPEDNVDIKDDPFKECRGLDFHTIQWLEETDRWWLSRVLVKSWLITLQRHCTVRCRLY